MSAFAGFADLADYITRRCDRDRTNPSAVSVRLGWARVYLGNAAAGVFQMSRGRCAELAQAFGDEPTLVLTLAGHVDLPPERDRWLDEVRVLAAAVPKPKRRQVLAYLRELGESRPPLARKIKRAR